VILFHAVILRQDLQNFRQKQARWRNSVDPEGALLLVWI
jgi:hypothetical protein